MKPSIQFALLTIFILLSFQARAWVNPTDGSFRLEVELIPGSLKANYSNRRTTHGVLGLGWCTLLDLNIVFFDDDQIILDKCSHREVFKKPHRHSKIYFNQSREESIRFDRGQFYYLQKGQVRSLLVSKKYFTNSPKKRIELYFLRRGFRPRDIAIQENSQGRVSRINIRGFEVSLSYSNSSLSSVQNQKERLDFNWDQLQNINSVKRNGLILLSLNYDGEDRVSSLKSSQCELIYSYSVPQKHLSKTRLLKKCKKQEPLLVDFFNHYQQSSREGGLSLSSMEVKKHQFTNKKLNLHVTKFQFKEVLQKERPLEQRRPVFNKRRISNET